MNVWSVFDCACVVCVCWLAGRHNIISIAVGSAAERVLCKNCARFVVCFVLRGAVGACKSSKNLSGVRVSDAVSACCELWLAGRLLTKTLCRCVIVLICA